MALEKEDIMALIAILQKGLEDEDSEIEIPKTDKATKPRKKAKKKTKQERTNKFLSMPERNLHKADTLIDKKLNVMPPTERSRQFSVVSVKCRVCGKTEEVNPKYLEAKERYKCNKCSTSAG